MLASSASCRENGRLDFAAADIKVGRGGLGGMGIITPLD